MSRNWIIAGVAAVCFITGVALSHVIDPGVRVEKVMLTTNTPALRLFPATPGPHPNWQPNDESDSQWWMVVENS